MPATQTIIRPVAIQPPAFSQPLTAKRPKISLREAISIMTTMIGTATTPFSTALQNRALIGLIPEKLIIMPTKVASVTVA